MAEAARARVSDVSTLAMYATALKFNFFVGLQNSVIMEVFKKLTKKTFSASKGESLSKMQPGRLHDVHVKRERRTV